MLAMIVLFVCVFVTSMCVAASRSMELSTLGVLVFSTSNTIGVMALSLIFNW